MAKIALWSLVLIALSHLCGGYKILVVYPLSGKSHHILGAGYVKHLLEAGHEVTYATPFPTNKTTDKYHEVDLSENIEHFNKQAGKILNLKAILNKEITTNVLVMVPEFIDMIQIMFESENLVKFLSDPTQEFDAVIVEWLFTDVFSGIASLYNCPLIWASSVEAHWLVLQLIHEPSNPSYNANVLSTKIPPFSFFERAANLFTMAAFKAAKYFYIQPRETAIYEEFYTPLFAKRGTQVAS